MKKVLFAIVFMFIINLVKGQTFFGEGSGIYGEMLNNLKKSLYESDELSTVILDGQERRIFVLWIRDHIHTMKAFKYWEKDMASYLAFYMGRQTGKGMYYDYCRSYKDRNVGQMHFTNCFPKEFYFVDVTNQNFFFRMPIEADLEYLLVEGVYTNWQTSGDEEYLKRWLPVLVKGMKYEMSDPLRWSDKYLLIKRPYSIDTWDFTAEPDSLSGTERLLYTIGNFPETPKGIMHGDNTGMFQACRQLSDMFRAVGQFDAAREWELQGNLFLHRTNTLCWNGKFYAHFIPEDPVPVHINTDPVNSIGLSNAYSINRGAATPAMAASIIETYREIGEKMKGQSLAPWYGIYPFVEPMFGKIKVGEYMNGAILPLVGGELVKAAFQNGREYFAVEQLKLAMQIMKINNGRLPGCVNFDGTAQEEYVPDEWGQAAFVSALVEGLAGIVDKDILFRKVELSPRWYFAGINNTNIQVGYGSDGDQVKYRYSYNPSANRMEIQTEGKFIEFTLRVPFPEKTNNATASINGQKTFVTTEQINNSRYAVIKGKGNGNIVIFNFR